MATITARLLQNWRVSASQVAFSQVRNASVICKKLEFSKYGDPMEVISKVEEELNVDLQPKQVLVKMLAAPLNPADINTVQGKYAVKPDSFPSVLGNEGVGEVLACGSQVKHTEVGDWVIPFLNQFGTCRSHAVTPEEDVVKIRKTVPLVEAATMSVNPCTSFRMLNDFVTLEDEDVVIQNGANSAVGQAVIQMCRVYNYRSVNIVRSRDDLDQLKEYLTSLGATVILTEEELRTTQLFKSGELPRPRLGLNCIGGASATEVARQLAPSATLVTYGAMSRAPLTVPTAQMIFSDLRMRGFWMTSWTRAHSVSRARWEMLDEMQTLCDQGYFKAPRHELVHIDDWQEAVRRTMPGGGRVGSKQILIFDRDLKV